MVTLTSSLTGGSVVDGAVVVEVVGGVVAVVHEGTSIVIVTGLYTAGLRVYSSVNVTVCDPGVSLTEVPMLAPG